MNGPAEIQFVGLPDGPNVFVPEFGCEVGTFTLEPGGNGAAIMHHVPLEYRGDFRPKELANYSSEKPYRTDAFGKMVCHGRTLAGNDCSRRAVNRYPYCNAHGGRLHPLDKLIKDEAPEDVSQTRYQLYKSGQLTVDDLDDEELATCGFRSKDGRIYKPRNVPREISQAFQKAIFERANEQLKSLVVEAANTVGEIMKDKFVEPDIRLKAALSLLERNLGKTPQVVAITDAKGYEEIFDEILHVRSERPPLPSGSIIEAEVVESPLDSGDQTISGRDRSGPENDSATGEVGTSFPEFNDGTQGENSGHFGSAEQSDGGSAGSERGYERNPAILAQFVESKPFEYDLSDKRDQIKKATKKRYASKAFGSSAPTVPYVPFTVIKTQLDNGLINIRYVEPVMPKIPKPKNSDNKRKSFTLSDFD